MRAWLVRSVEAHDNVAKLLVSCSVSTGIIVEPSAYSVAAVLLFTSFVSADQ